MIVFAFTVINVSFVVKVWVSHANFVTCITLRDSIKNRLSRHPLSDFVRYNSIRFQTYLQEAAHHLLKFTIVKEWTSQESLSSLFKKTINKKTKESICFFLSNNETRSQCVVIRKLFSTMKEAFQNKWYAELCLTLLSSRMATIFVQANSNSVLKI
jgi:hypothetical protein